MAFCSHSNSVKVQVKSTAVLVWIMGVAPDEAVVADTIKATKCIAMGTCMHEADIMVFYIEVAVEEAINDIHTGRRITALKATSAVTALQ